MFIYSRGREKCYVSCKQNDIKTIAVHYPFRRNIYDSKTLHIRVVKLGLID